MWISLWAVTQSDTIRRTSNPQLLVRSCLTRWFLCYAHSQNPHLRQVNCGFSSFASLEIPLVIQLLGFERLVLVPISLFLLLGDCSSRVLSALLLWWKSSHTLGMLRFSSCESLAKTLPLQSLVCSWVGIVERGVCLRYSWWINAHIRQVCSALFIFESLAKTLPLQSLVCSWVGIAERGVLSALLLMNKCSHTVFKIQNSKFKINVIARNSICLSAGYPPTFYVISWQSTFYYSPPLVRTFYFSLFTFYFSLFSFYSGLLYI